MACDRDQSATVEPRRRPIISGDALRARSRARHRHCATGNSRRRRCGCARTSKCPRHLASFPADRTRPLRKCRAPDENPLPGKSRAMNGGAFRRCSLQDDGSTRPPPSQTVALRRRAHLSMRPEDSRCSLMPNVRAPRSKAGRAVRRSGASTTQWARAPMMRPARAPMMRPARVPMMRPARAPMMQSARATVAVIEPPGRRD